MNAFSDHVFAIKHGFDELSSGKFWVYLIPSVAISLIFLLIYWVIGLIIGTIGMLDMVPWVGDYIASGIDGIERFVNFLLMESYAFLILTVLSPVNCLLSQKVDNEATGAKFDGGFLRILTDLGRAVLIFSVALILNFICMGIWWAIARITGFHALDALVYFVIGAFFIGFSFYDFSLERYRTGLFSSWSFGFGNMSYMLMTGALFALIFRIPYLGIMFAPFLVTIFSTLVYLKMHNRIPVSTASGNRQTR